MNEEPLVSYTSQPQPVKSHKGLKITLIVFLVLVFLGAVGYAGYYLWDKNRTLQADVSSRDTEIKDLKAQVADLSATDAAVESDDSRFKIRELGVSLELPDKLKDLTYSYTGKSPSARYEGHGISLSTKTLTDLDKACTSFGAAPPLGSLVKVTGQYPKDANVDTTPGQLVKQFSGYYVAVSHAQAACGNEKTDATTIELRSLFKDALPTIKEL
jgi:hypothetical protein